MTRLKLTEEVFDPSENFWVCIFWDVVFHLTLACNLQQLKNRPGMTWKTWKTWQDCDLLSSVMPELIDSDRPPLLITLGANLQP